MSIDSSKQCGHLLLMCNTERAEKAWFKYYQEKVPIHGINLQRKRHCNFDIADGASIPDKTTAVAWCDGDLSHLDAIKRSVEMYVENKIIANTPDKTHTQLETYQLTDAP